MVTEKQSNEGAQAKVQRQRAKTAKIQEAELSGNQTAIEEAHQWEDSSNVQIIEA